jgi:4-carboxymuconolactone decarboxylase
MASEKFENGLRVRKEVLGEEYVNRNMSTVDDFNRDFQEMVTEMAWSTWARDGLERKQRSPKFAETR